MLTTPTKSSITREPPLPRLFDLHPCTLSRQTTSRGLPFLALPRT